MKISIAKARKLAVRSQGLDLPWKLPKGKEGIAQVIERIGYVQIDTISVVQRAHHHTLWSRRPDYDPQMLHELQAQDRRVFEWWAHAAAYIPMNDYRYYITRMRAFAARPRDREWIEQNRQVVDNVVERIRNEGPLGSSDFPDPEGGRGTWWSWKPAKRALEMLFNSGELMVTERRKFQRIYDLAERVLPPDLDTSEPDDDEMARFIIRQKLNGRGFASSDLARWGHHGSRFVPDAIEDMRSSGEITELEISGLGDETYYALTENVEEASKRSRKQLHILSPFDNLVIDRGRLRSLFNFGYKLECYLPAAKRKYGYFSLAVLWGKEFVGRLDPKADRKKKTFIVRNMIFEPSFRNYKDIMPILAKKLWSFASFNGCKSIVVEQTLPEKIGSHLKQELESSRIE